MDNQSTNLKKTSPLFGKCSSCGDTDYIWCPNCKSFTDFYIGKGIGLMPDQPCAICACGHRINGYQCSCGAAVYAQNLYKDEARANELLIDKDKILKRLSKIPSTPDELKEQFAIQWWIGMIVGTPILLFIIYLFSNGRFI